MDTDESIESYQLDEAIQMSSLSSVQRLLKEGARDWVLDDAQGWLVKAVLYGRHDVLNAFLDLGGNPNQIGQVTLTSAVSSSTPRAPGNPRRRLTSPLILAVRRDDLQMVDRLLDDARTQVAMVVNDNTALHIAAAYGLSAMAERLLDAGASMTFVPPRTSLFGSACAFHVACEQAHVEMAQLLLARSSDPQGMINQASQREDAPTPLMAAAWFGCEPLVRLLLERGADRGALDQRGKTVMDRTADQVQRGMSPSFGLPQAVQATLIEWEREQLYQALESTSSEFTPVRPRL